MNDIKDFHKIPIIHWNVLIDSKLKVKLKKNEISLKFMIFEICLSMLFAQYSVSVILFSFKQENSGISH